MWEVREVLWQSTPYFLAGLWVTIKISILALLFGTSFGFAVGLVRAVNVPYLASALGLYIHVLRATPFLVQLYIVYFVLPATGLALLELEAYPAAVIALSIYTSTYAAEIIRAAIEAVPKGQSEAGLSVGMNLAQRMWYVILPQALKMTIPPMGGLYVTIIKGTSIVSVIGISELVRVGENLTMREPQFLLSIYLAVACFYFIYCYPLLRLAKWAEGKLGHVDVSL